MEEFETKSETLYEKILDVMVFIAVFIVTAFLMLEFLIMQSEKIGVSIEQLNSVYAKISVFIFIIFALDLYRLRKKSKDWKIFFKYCWLDILATIPFGLMGSRVFEITKIVRLNKIFKLTRASKITKISRIAKISKEFKPIANFERESLNYSKKIRI